MVRRSITSLAVENGRLDLVANISDARIASPSYTGMISIVVAIRTRKCRARRPYRYARTAS